MKNRWMWLLMLLLALIVAVPVTAQDDPCTVSSTRNPECFTIAKPSDYQWAIASLGQQAEFIPNATTGGQIAVSGYTHFIDVLEADLGSGSTREEVIENSTYAMPLSEWHPLIQWLIGEMQSPPECQGDEEYTDGDCYFYVLNRQAVWFVESLQIQAEQPDTDGDTFLIVEGYNEFIPVHFESEGGGGGQSTRSYAVSRTDWYELMIWIGEQLEVRPEVTAQAPLATPNAPTLAAPTVAAPLTDNLPINTIFVVSTNGADMTLTIEYPNEQTAIVVRSENRLQCNGDICASYSRMFDEEGQYTEISADMRYMVVYNQVGFYTSMAAVPNAENGQIAYGGVFYRISENDNGRILTVGTEAANAEATETVVVNGNYANCAEVCIYVGPEGSADGASRLVVLVLGNEHGNVVKTTHQRNEASFTLRFYNQNDALLFGAEGFSASFNLIETPYISDDISIAYQDSIPSWAEVEFAGSSGGWQFEPQVNILDSSEWAVLVNELNLD